MLMHPAPMHRIASAPKRKTAGDSTAQPPLMGVKLPKSARCTMVIAMIMFATIISASQTREQSYDDENRAEHFPQVNAVRHERRHAISLDPCHDRIDAVHDLCHAVKQQQPADGQA